MGDTHNQLVQKYCLYPDFEKKSLDVLLCTGQSSKIGSNKTIAYEEYLTLP